MANEITILFSLALVNGGHRESFVPGTLQLNQSAIGAHAPIVKVGTSEEDLAVGDIATPGVIVLQNLDATNYITYGPKSGGAMVAAGRLNPGEVHCFRLDPGATLRWKANAAEAKAKVLLLEN